MLPQEAGDSGQGSGSDVPRAGQEASEKPRTRQPEFGFASLSKRSVLALLALEKGHRPLDTGTGQLAKTRKHPQGIETPQYGFTGLPTLKFRVEVLGTMGHENAEGAVLALEGLDGTSAVFERRDLEKALPTTTREGRGVG